MMLFDPSGDFATVVDGTEPVTLLRRGSNASTAVAHAMRRAIKSGEAAIVNSGDVHKVPPSGGRQLSTELVWHLPTAELPESPRLGDVILDGAGHRWTIMVVKLATVGARWRCETRNVAIAAGLDDTISIQKATTTLVYGLSTTTWNTWMTGVRARIQPLKTSVYPNADTPYTSTTYRIFVEEDIDIDHTCRICGPDGTIYTITSSTGAERIGELQVIAAVVSSDTTA